MGSSVQYTQISDHSAPRRLRLGIILAGLGLALSACETGFDIDMRGLTDGFSTATAARQVTADRPQPDARGVISYPSYQVAVANRGDTVTDVATRIGLGPAELARFNGLDADTRLRRGEILALPTRVAVVNDAIDITALASDAIDRAEDTPVATPGGTNAVIAGPEPVRHKVQSGETAYSIARLYDVSVRALGDWNSLGPGLRVRTGQYLLIPLTDPRLREEAAIVEAPGEGSETPEPPSATTALPEEDAAIVEAEEPPSPELGTQATQRARYAKPVDGAIIRPYKKGENEGIDIAAAVGTQVRAAEAGTVAAITRDTDQIPILVIRHADNLLTVYANIDDISVRKGDSIARGQVIAKVRAGDPSFLHFEIRQGFESVDPVPFIN